MTAVTSPQLRPLGMGQLLDRAVRLYRQNFLKFIGIVALVQIPVSLLQMIPAFLTMTSLPTGQFGAPSSDPFEIFNTAYVAGVTGAIVLGILNFVLIYGVATAALTRAIAAGYIGESLGITEAYRKIGPSWLSLIGALFVAIIIFLGLLIWTLIPCVGWLSGVGMIVFFGLVIVPLIAPAIVLERQTWTGAIRRAWDLARRRFWWVLGFVLILTIFAQLVVTGPAALIGFGFQLMVGNSFEYSTAQAALQVAVQAVVGLVANLIYLPLQLTAITLLYFDLRIRQEGFDLAVRSAEAQETTPDIAEITAQAPRPERGNWLTLTEFGYFILASLAGLVLYLIIVFLFAGIGMAFIGLAGGGF